MNRLQRVIMTGIAVLVLSVHAYGQDISGEQIKGLDEQVQDIKSDVLSIAAALNRLEEKLLFPSNTQVAVFVSLRKDESFRLDAIELQLDGHSVAHHLYTYKELEALQKGGVQRIFTGNLRSGDHGLQVVVMGKNDDGTDFRKTQQFTIHKTAGPTIMEISLAAGGIRLNRG